MNNPVWQDDQPPYEEKKPWWNSRPLIIVGIAIVLVLGLSLLWQVLSSDDSMPGEIPYITAESTPEKVKPEDAGGEEIPHQDKKIYELIDGSDGKVVRTVAAVENADQQIELPIGDAPATFSDATSLAPAEEAPTEAPKTVYNIKSKVVNISEANDTDAVDTKTIKTGDVPADAKMDNLPTHKYRVQVASLPSKAAAQAEIKLLKRKYSMLKGLKIRIVSAMVNGKTMHRIHTGPFDTAEDANSLCSSLQNAGGNCLVVKPSKK